MARPVSITKEKILSAAVGVVRKGGLSALTSRNLCTELGCGVNAVFSAYGSMEGVQEAVRADARESYIPNRGAGPQGDVDSYLMIQSLAGQNHLLQELHSHPRYIQDSEWTELERVLRNSFNLTPESLRETNPGLTKGDIRIYILSHFQFPVSEQAILLGISPTSVTKARQRLKAKLQ